MPVSRPVLSSSARPWLAGLLLATALAVALFPARAAVVEADADLQRVQAILGLPESELDYAEVKVTVDALVEPRLATGPLLQRLNAMAADVRAMLPSAATTDDRFEALRAYLYQPGPWNARRPFARNDDDPGCRSLRDKLLATYLDTRRGNCVSMSMLFLILGQKLGLDVSAAAAPQFVFVQYRDTGGLVRQLDASTNRITTDEALKREWPMSPLSIARGTWLRALSRREGAALMAELLLDASASRPALAPRRIAMATLLLQHNPRQVQAWSHLAQAWHQLGLREADPRRAQAQARIARQRAEALGWKVPEGESPVTAGGLPSSLKWVGHETAPR